MDKNNNFYNNHDDDEEDIDELLYDAGLEDEIDEAYDRRNNKARYIAMGVAAVVCCICIAMLVNIFWSYRKGVQEYKDIEDQVFKTTETSSNPSTSKTQGDNGNQNKTESASGQNEIQELGPFTYDHQALLSINSDGVGYIYMPGIAVRLPIAQCDNNEFYLDHTFNRNSNSTGALFVDAGITGGLDGTNVIIYGHNMKNGSMFAGLTKYKNESFYSTEGNDIFYIYTENKVLEYRIFSAYECAADADTYTYNFNTAKGLREYASSMKEASLYDTGVDVSNATQVVTLSTCTSDGKRRIVVQGVYVGESVQE